jgi:hypothetical protein
MNKSTTLSIRFDPQELAALAKLAAADDRPVSAMVRKIVLDWLRDRRELTEISPPLLLPSRPRRLLEWFRYQPTQHSALVGLYSTWLPQFGLAPFYVGTTQTSFEQRFGEHTASFARGEKTFLRAAFAPGAATQAAFALEWQRVWALDLPGRQAAIYVPDIDPLSAAICAESVAFGQTIVPLVCPKAPDLHTLQLLETRLQQEIRAHYQEIVGPTPRLRWRIHGGDLFGWSHISANSPELDFDVAYSLDGALLPTRAAFFAHGAGRSVAVAARNDERPNAQ